MDAKYKQPILGPAYRMIYTKKGNCLIGITGSVNTGKSHTGVWLAWRFSKDFNIEVSLVYSVEDLIHRSLAFIKYKGKPLDLEMFDDIDDVSQWLKDNMEHIYINPGNAVIMDETGALGAYVREFFSMDNKSLAKIIQIWRILRMLVIFIVPEDISLAESTISKFLNLEIQMLGIDAQKNMASCVAYEYFGWNKKTKERMKRRVDGCKHGGRIWVPPLPQEIEEHYESTSKSHKIAALVNMGKEFKMNKPIQVGATKSIWDDVKYVKEHIDEFKNEKGQVTISMIQSKLNVSQSKARMIRSHIKQDA